MNQLILPLDLEVTLQKDDLAFHVHHLVESINMNPLMDFSEMKDARLIIYA